MKPRVFFEQWQATSVFKREVIQVEKSMTEVEYFSRQAKWLREAHLASIFAQKTGAKRVRLAANDVKREDFEVLLRNGNAMQVQAAEAIQPGRKRKEEYLRLAELGSWAERDPVENWLERRRALPAIIREIAKNKTAKGYSRSISLLIYVNLGPTYGYWNDEIEVDLIECTAPARGQFRTVWALWNDRLYRCWPTPFLGLRWSSQ
ncbi:MAG: hypothetical protein RIC14_01360 [Filomicrobium sp.]